MSRVSFLKANQVNNGNRLKFRRCLLVALAVAALTTACAAGNSTNGSAESAAPIPSAAGIWFHPLPAAMPAVGWDPPGGSVDFPELFVPNAPWPRALAHTQAFGMYAGWITEVSDEDLKVIVDFLNAHHMGIEIEAPALQALSYCGSGVEGYVPYGQSLETFTLAYLQKLQALGAPVAFIKVDEPYYFGTVVNDPRSCHFPVEQVALEVGQYVQLVKSIYPNVYVGDVEPIIASAYSPDIFTAMAIWHATYQRITGAAFPFFFADIQFANPAWPVIVKQLERETRQHGSQFGIIYIGDPTDTSDEEWALKTVARFKIYEIKNGGRPDFVLFQSWEVHPRFCLPETDPLTFTGVLDAYLDATN
jgi:hypothetical protein